MNDMQPNGDSKSILIIEDEPALSSLLVKKFDQAKFHVMTAVDGKDGLTMALDRKPDIILLDIVMPRMDGITMLKELRKDSWGKDARVIILTNLVDSRSLAQALGEGAYDYFIKTDWDVADIVTKVEEKLATPPQAA